MNNKDGSNVVLIISVLLSIFGTYRIVQDSMTYFWEPVKAKIIKYDVRCCSSKGESESVYVQYEYRHENVDYISDSISLNYRDINNRGEKVFVKNKERTYVVGQKLSAYVYGKQSVLEKGISESTLYIFLTSIFFFILSRLFLYR